MHVLTHHGPRAGRLAGSVGTRLADMLGRPLTRAKQGILSRCRPVIRTLGMSEKPWSAVYWILVAAVLALLFVITFMMFEGSMWT